MLSTKSKGLLALFTALLCVSLAFAFMVNRASAHKVAHDAETLQAFTDAFMEQVILGDNLFHGASMEGINMSNTGMACAMCHPFSSDVHSRANERVCNFARHDKLVHRKAE